MRGQGRSVAVLDVNPLTVTCALGWPDIQGQAHLNAAVQGRHSGLEAGRFARIDEMPPLVRRLLRSAQSESATRADGIFVSVPSEYTQVYMQQVELPIRRQVTETDLRELKALAAEAMVPAEYRLLHCKPIAWQLDREMLYRSPVGMRGKLLQGYYALTYGYGPYLHDMESIVDQAGISLRGFADVPGAVMRYAAGKLNLLGSFVLLDSDELFTTVMVAQRGKIWMLQRIPLGMQRFCQDIMQAEGVEYAQAWPRMRQITLDPRSGDRSPAAQVITQRISELLLKVENTLTGANLSLQDPIHLVLSGAGWTGLTGVEFLLAQHLGARITALTPPPSGASIHSMAMLDQVLVHGTRERTLWEKLTEKITQTKQ